jgi:hypothetical protein
MNNHVAMNSSDRIAMTTRASILFTVATVLGITPLSRNADNAVAQEAIHPPTINNARGVRAAVTACWNALGDVALSTARISVRVSFDRDGKVFGTYATPAPNEEARETVREAITRALKLCEPPPFSDTFRDVVAVHPIGVRLGNGWKSRIRS